MIEYFISVDCSWLNRRLCLLAQDSNYLVLAQVHKRRLESLPNASIILNHIYLIIDRLMPEDHSSCQSQCC